MLSYKYGADELCIYLDAKASLPTQTDILDDDPLEGDTSYLLRYGDWRKVGAVMTPFSLRYVRRRWLRSLSPVWTNWPSM